MFLTMDQQIHLNFCLPYDINSVLKDETSRRAYDRELAAGKASSWRPRRPQRPSAEEQTAKDKEFNSFMDLFDETVSGMSEAELNMAMGAAAVVGSIIGSIVGAKAGKGNSLLSSAASMVGSAMASQAASTLGMRNYLCFLFRMQYMVTITKPTSFISV